MGSPAARIRWIGLKTLVRREWGTIMRFWFATLAPPVITTVLYFTIFGEVIGTRVGSFDGFELVQYMAPGLIMLWVITHAYGHTAGGFLGALIFRFLEELLVAPLPRWIVMLGYVIAGVIRGVLVGAVVAITMLVFTHLHIHSLAASVAVLVLAALVSALGGFIAALLASDFDHVYGIQNLVLVPLLYIGGVFTPVATLPGWAQTLTLANPMFYIVNAFRYGVLGVSDVPIAIAVWMLSLAALGLACAAIILMRRRVE
jgi:ABC-2 type transport system permease protein